MAKKYLPEIKRGPKIGYPDVDKIAAIPPTGSQQLIWAHKYPGLALNMSGGGKRSWVIMGRIAGKSVRPTLAQWGTPIDEVVVKHAEWRQAMMEGRNPLAEAKASAEEARRNQTPTLNQLVGEFMDIREGKLKPATVDLYLKSVRLWSADWQERQVDTLTPKEVTDRYQQIVREKSAGTANTWASAVRSMLNYAVGMEYIERSPFDVLKSQRLYEPSKARDNVITRDQMPTWLHYIWDRSGYGPGQGANPDFLLSGKNGGDWVWPAMMELVLLTGVRKGEMRAMRWSEIDVERWIWEIPADRTKTGKARVIPFTRRGIEIMKMAEKVTERTNERARRQAANDLVWFTSWVMLRPKKRPVSGWAHATGQVENATGIQHTWHDLRRTWSSIAATTKGVSEAARKRVMGHSNKSDVTDHHYTVLDPEDIREVLQLVEDRILAMANVAGYLRENVSKYGAEWDAIFDTWSRESGMRDDGVAWIFRGRHDNTDKVHHVHPTAAPPDKSPEIDAEVEHWESVGGPIKEG